MKSTTRQEQVLALLLSGLSMKQVAQELDIPVRTVAYEKYRIMERNGLRTSAELLRFAAQRGLSGPAADPPLQANRPPPGKVGGFRPHVWC